MRRSFVGLSRQEYKLKLGVVEERILTAEEMESVASILFAWWHRAFEGGHNQLDRAETGRAESE
jgi:hypothetical protein